MLQRKRPCQTQAQNNGGQLWGNRAICMQLFAVSRTTKANQRNLNGGWQASTNAFALCLCQLSPLCLPSKNGPVFVFDWSDIPPVLIPAVWCPDAEDFCEGLKVVLLRADTQNTWARTRVFWPRICSRQNGNISAPKPPLSFRFISRVLKANECNSADGFRCNPSSNSATSNFKGVDRKQNMYYEVGCCREWIIGCQLERKKNSQNATYWGAATVHALLAWAQ